jgi:hypothetical protein
VAAIAGGSIVIGGVNVVISPTEPTTGVVPFLLWVTP